MGCPDWTGSSRNWHPLQTVERRNYRLNQLYELEFSGSKKEELRLFKKPCAFGGMRYATSAMLQNGDRMVVKRILKENSTLQRNQKILEVCIAVPLPHCSVSGKPQGSDQSAIALLAFMCTLCKPADCR